MGVAVLAAGAVTPASAAFKLTIGGCNSFNAPLNELENMRTDGVALGRFDLTIGDTAYNFDRITDPDNTANPLSSVVVEKGDFPDDNESSGSSRSVRPLYMLWCDPTFGDRASVAGNGALSRLLGIRAYGWVAGAASGRASGASSLATISR
jgi:hypothetical protein